MSRLYACKLDVYIPGSSTAVPTNLAHGTRPYGTPPDTSSLESVDTIRASDVGYRDLSEGIYPPLLDTAFEVDRVIPLAPAADAVGATWGTMTLLNPDGTWDGVASSRSCDGRTVQIFTGNKLFDTLRGIYLDPPFASLTPVFRGVASGWFLSETALEVPLLDASYWLDRPLQTNFYTGTGGYNGDNNLTGAPKPKTRGGTPSNPVKNVSPVLIDAVNLVYQYNDGPGTVVALYEGAAVTYTYDGDTTNLYTSPPAPGRYKTDNSRGIFRLGTKPIRPITADVTGQFPLAGIRTKAAEIARELLLEDGVVPITYIDTASFTTVNTAFGWTAGAYFGPESINIRDAVNLFLRSLGAKLVSTRNGTLAVRTLRAIAPGAIAASSWTPANIVNLTPMRLGAPLDPPTDLWRIGHQKNHTVQTSDLSPAITDAARSFVSTEWRIASFFSAAVNADYRRPNRPDVLETALLSDTEASLLASAIGALWGVRRRLYAVEVPVSVGLTRDLGDIVRLVYPIDDLTNGKLGTIVGEQFRSTDSTMTLQVLV